LLVRPAQPTLGSLVLCARGEDTAYGDLPAESFAEQGELVTRIERTLQQFSRYERINYLMLMMVDPHVHFHVLPRYAGERLFENTTFADKGCQVSPIFPAPTCQRCFGRGTPRSLAGAQESEGSNKPVLIDLHGRARRPISSLQGEEGD
jgi:diadenosine tetraphosphate (Ap4A) HIT family hydrolase